MPVSDASRPRRKLQRSCSGLARNGSRFPRRHFRKSPSAASCTACHIGGWASSSASSMCAANWWSAFRWRGCWASTARIVARPPQGLMAVRKIRRKAKDKRAGANGRGWIVCWSRSGTGCAWPFPWMKSTAYIGFTRSTCANHPPPSPAPASPAPTGSFRGAISRLVFLTPIPCSPRLTGIFREKAFP